MKKYTDVKLWQDVSPSQWNDYKWQLKNSITTTDDLEKIVLLRAGEKEQINRCLKQFKMAITPYYALQMDYEDYLCPIRQQAIPCYKELQSYESDMNDPLCEEEYSPVEGLVHRYSDRVLMLLTHKCSMYCRHCTRRRLVGSEDCSMNEQKLDQALNYIKSNPVIRDVLLSGGDPLVLNDSHLEHIIKKIREIPHVEII